MEKRLVWMDLEMSGLNPEQDVILEIATIITDENLNIIEEGPTLVVNHSNNLWNRMDDWNKEHHSKSGLWEKVQNSNLTLEEAEQQTLNFIKKHVNEKQSPLCGNSIWQDRRFLIKHMPTLESFLHYRLIDVSSFKEVMRSWYPNSDSFSKKESHRALDDIKESIEELRFYKKSFFK